MARKKLGAGTPRGLAAAKTAFASLQKVLWALYRPRGRRCLGLATFWAVDRLPLDSQCWNFQTAQQSENGHFCHGLLACGDTLLVELRPLLHIHPHPQNSKRLHLRFHLGRVDHPERAK